MLKAPKRVRRGEDPGSNKVVVVGIIVEEEEEDDDNNNGLEQVEIEMKDTCLLPVEL